MAIIFNRTSLEVPALQVPPSLLDVQDAAPVVWEAITSDPSSFLGIENRNATRDAKLARYGGGAYAVLTPTWEVTVSGLSALIPQIEWMVDGPLPKSLDALFPDGDPYSLALVDDALNYLWASRGGTITKVTGSLLPPAGGPWVYLGLLEMASTALVGGHDKSGVATLIGNQLWVRTADGGEPAWTPPAGIRYWHRTAGGVWQWDGEAWLGQQSSWQTNKATIPAGEHVTIPAGEQMLLFGDITINGELTVDGELLLLGGTD